MRNEITYSIEKNELLNAERAYELYWAGALTDQKAFRCPDEKCPAEFTCINMYRAANEQKQQPHFRERIKHRLSCDFVEELIRQGSHSYASGQQTNPAAPLPDRFLLRRPANDLVRSETTTAAAGVPRGGKHWSDWIAGARRRSTEFYSLGRLVSRWLQARKAGEAGTRTVQIASGAPTPYASLFTCLYPRNRPISEEAKVYWGKAKIRRSSDGSGYSIYFSEPIQFMSAEGNISLKPILSIKDSHIGGYPLKSAVNKIIESAINEHEAWCTAFSYCTPKPPRSGGSFIDLTPHALDFIAIEPVTLLSEI
ncbi:hypothetical protein [Pseudoxanthomonas winnipegensis]|uniref:hypothetical protein n=1 Tax=Pseudoxanthomonas winnipegensis TaxID=2480810 RepID=UPI003F8750B0